jgi:hypothetical protein
VTETPPLRWGRWLAAAGLVYTAYVVAYTWPLPVEATDHLRSVPIWGVIDLDLHMWTLAWVSRAVVRDPLRLFDANIFHPARLTLAGSDHLLGALPVAGPVYWLTHNPVATVNAVVLSSFPLAGLAAFALVAATTGSGWAGLLAGFVYAFVPWRTRSFVPVQTFSIQYLPLALLALTAYLRRGRRRLLAAGLAALVLQLLVAYYVAYAALVALAVWLVAVAFAARDVPVRRWVVLGAGIALALGIVAAVSWPYLVRRDTGAIRTYGGALGTATLVEWLGPGLLERGENVYLGFLPLGLGLVAVLPPFVPERRLRTTLGAFLGLAVTGWVLCLGSHAVIGGIRVPLPYSWLAAIVPGFSSMRIALRFFTVTTFGVAGLAAVGLERVRGWLPPWIRATAAAALVAGVLWEYGPLEWPMRLDPVPVGTAVPDAYRWLAVHGDGGPLLELPVGWEGSMSGTRRESLAMYFSTVHWLPLLNGYTAYPPRSHALLMRVARQLPEPDAVQTLARCAGVRWILVHLDLVPAAERAAWDAVPGLAVAARFAGDAVLEVEGTPAGDCQEGLRTPHPGRTAAGVSTAPLARAARVGRIEDAGVPATVMPGGAEARVRIANLGDAPWPGLALEDGGLVHLAVTWEAGGVPARTQEVPLAGDLAPGASTRLRFVLHPPGPGVYRVTFALRQEGEPFPDDTAPALVRTVTVPGPA